MVIKKTYTALWISLLLLGVLTGCGNQGAASFEESASNTEVNLESISVTPINSSLAENTTQQFTAIGIYSDSTTTDLTSSVIWTSSDVDTVDIASGGNGVGTTTSSFSVEGAAEASRSPGHTIAMHPGEALITAQWGNISGTAHVTVTPATLISIAVTPSNPSLAMETTRQFTATGTFSDNTTQDLTASTNWMSSNAAVATISDISGSKGTATGVAAGLTTITATSEGISGSTTLTVTSATLVSLAVTPTNPSIGKGTTQWFAATGMFSDSTTQDMTTSVTWYSSAEFVATISNTSGSRGLTTSVDTGSTTITATSGSISGSTTLTVTSATLASIVVTPTNPSIVKGTTQQFTATGIYSDSSTQDLTTAVTWDSSAEFRATISNAAGSDGLASAIAAGSATITATSGSISGSTSLTVTSATLVSIAVTPTNPSIVSGTTQQFTATGTYSDSSTQDLTTSVTWNSSRTYRATISNAAGSNGLASAIAAGSTTITATSGSISGSTSLTVTSATLVSIAVTPTNPSIVNGTTQQFTATGTYSDSSTQDLTTAVTWDSSRAYRATISNAAGSNGLASAIAAGSATITATSGSISGSTSLTVTSATLVSIAVTPTNPSIVEGTTQQFTATGTYSDSSTQDLTTVVTWNSSAESVATISNAAGSRGLSTSGDAGSTTITATSGNVSGTTTLTVEAMGVVTLTWDAPTTYTDASPLDPLTGLSTYKIYYGTAPNMYTQVVTIANPGTTTITESLNLAGGTYYFVVTTVDISGAESNYSNEAIKTI
jgi:hypothetical protein